MPGYTAFLWLHIASGVIALATFWTAALARKGGPRHRLAGRVFLLAMCVILVTGVPLAAQRFLEGRANAGVFLGYLLVITAQAMWMAWHAVRDKRDWRAMVARPAYAGLQWGSGLAGLGVLALGIAQGIALFIGFSLIGIVLAVQMRQFAMRGPKRPNWHVQQHYQAMLGCGVATHVAFLTIGLRPAWAWLERHTAVPPALVELLPWFGPVAVALIAAIWLDRRHGRGRHAAVAQAARTMGAGR